MTPFASLKWRSWHAPANDWGQKYAPRDNLMNGGSFSFLVSPGIGLGEAIKFKILWRKIASNSVISTALEEREKRTCLLPEAYDSQKCRTTRRLMQWRQGEWAGRHFTGERDGERNESNFPKVGSRRKGNSCKMKATKCFKLISHNLALPRGKEQRMFFQEK